jgi:CrcB protein
VCSAVGRVPSKDYHAGCDVAALRERLREIADSVKSRSAMISSAEHMRLALIAIGGAIGSLSRYALDGLVYRFAPATFPYGTFAVNLTGCLVFGLIIGQAEQRFAVGSPARSFCLIGVLGAFTTFSTYTFETFGLLRDGQFTRAMVNAFGQLVGGLIALWAGYAASAVLR